MHCAKVDSDVLVSSRAKVDREAYDLQRQTGLSRTESLRKARQPVSSFNLDCVRTRQQSADLQYLLKLLLPRLERQAEGQFTCPGNRDGQSRVAGRPLHAQRRTEAGSVISIKRQPLLPNSHCLKFSLPVQAEPQGAMIPPSRTRRQLDHFFRFFSFFPPIIFESQKQFSIYFRIIFDLRKTL